MAPPATDTGESTLARIWWLIRAPLPGRGGHSLRMAAACSMVVLIGEIWQIPDVAVPALCTMAVWQKDRTTNMLAGVAINILIIAILALLFVLIHLTLDHPFGQVVAIMLLSFTFFFLGSASKLKPVAYLLGLIVVFALVVADQVPIGEIATRALLYADLFILVPGAVMIVCGPLICPSPATLMMREIAARLRLCATLLEQPDGYQLDYARATLRAGAGGMLKLLKMARLEKILHKDQLAHLEQSAYSSVAALALAHTAFRDGEVQQASQEFSQTLRDMAEMFSHNGYPQDIPLLSAPDNAPALAQLAIVLHGFTEPAAPTPQDAPPAEQKSGFFTPDAFSNPEHVRFAVKGTGAVLISYFIFTILNWPGIHTCIITCFIVALPTVGEMTTKLRLRISGALVGGAIGIASIIFVMPHLYNIAAFLLLIFVVSLFASWVKNGDERIAYAGFQIGLAFFLSDLKGYGPTTDMTTARDRIIGILLGNFITYAVFATFWPSSAYTPIAKRCRTLLDVLKKQIATTNPAEHTRLAATVQEDLSSTERALELAEAEPPHMRAHMPLLPTYAMITRQAAIVAEDGLLPSRRKAVQQHIQDMEQALT
ncbi:fusaric acid resistance protein [Acetobacter lambici]|uniref:FUSC family protein n=1 Tax=Acetobacter lambici TaxID=1332824 RepID=A0ABT1F0S2_9PROT|nr:FUSC family protein [Acetobacter lambici]MCP1242574.1 FUSC family protein [Acetobacter lambici]MCP1258795.1 FUSC family protein [Acetobacter lambici]NHO57002.1 fusaric acid resistance protein [Acetobacter lambici]